VSVGKGEVKRRTREEKAVIARQNIRRRDQKSESEKGV